MTIKKLFANPIKGLNSTELKHAFICPYGLMYDKELLILDVGKHTIATSTTNVELTNLKQEIIYDPPSILITTAKPENLISKNLSVELTISLTDDLNSLNNGK